LVNERAARRRAGLTTTIHILRVLVSSAAASHIFFCVAPDATEPIISVALFTPNYRPLGNFSGQYSKVAKKLEPHFTVQFVCDKPSQNHISAALNATHS
jgi:hypothetical protein